VPASPKQATLETSAYASAAAPEISVVVSTFGRSAFLEALLGSFESQTMSLSRFEVVLVDNGSKDDTWARISEAVRHTPLRLLALRLAENAGAGAGRNAGIHAARSPVLAFTDDDCVPTAEWLEELTRPFLKLGAHLLPHLVVQGRTHPWPKDSEGAGAWARTVWVLNPTWLFETCNIAYRREDLELANGFPEGDDAPRAATKRAFGEDADLGWRVVEAGAQLKFVDEAVVQHRHIPGSYRQWLTEQRRRGDFPLLVGRNRLGRNALWNRWFLASRTAAFDAAVLGTLGWKTSRRPACLLAWLPWLWLALPEASQRTGRHPVVRLAQLCLGDLVGMSALVAGSVKSRSVVL